MSYSPINFSTSPSTSEVGTLTLPVFETRLGTCYQSSIRDRSYRSHRAGASRPRVRYRQRHCPAREGYRGSSVPQRMLQSPRPSRTLAHQTPVRERQESAAANRRTFHPAQRTFRIRAGLNLIVRRRSWRTPPYPVNI